MEKLKDVKFVLLYFSGSYCPPCKKFTPILKAFYEEINSDGYNIEIVLVPSDKDEQSYTDYFDKMPWTSIPFNDPVLSLLK